MNPEENLALELARLQGSGIRVEKVYVRPDLYDLLKAHIEAKEAKYPAPSIYQPKDLRYPPEIVFNTARGLVYVLRDKEFCHACGQEKKP